MLTISPITILTDQLYSEVMIVTDPHLFLHQFADILLKNYSYHNDDPNSNSNQLLT